MLLFCDGQVLECHYLEDACNLGCHFCQVCDKPSSFEGQLLTEMVVHAAPSHERQHRTHMPTKPVQCIWGLHHHLCHQTLRSHSMVCEFAATLFMFNLLLLLLQ
jgi:hypothetical protein